MPCWASGQEATNCYSKDYLSCQGLTRIRQIISTKSKNYRTSIRLLA